MIAATHERVSGKLAGQRLTRLVVYHCIARCADCHVRSGTGLSTIYAGIVDHRCLGTGGDSPSRAWLASTADDLGTNWRLILRAGHRKKVKFRNDNFAGVNPGGRETCTYRSRGPNDPNVLYIGGDRQPTITHNSRVTMIGWDDCSDSLLAAPPFSSTPTPVGEPIVCDAP